MTDTIITTTARAESARAVEIVQMLSGNQPVEPPPQERGQPLLLALEEQPEDSRTAPGAAESVFLPVTGQDAAELELQLEAQSLVSLTAPGAGVLSLLLQLDAQLDAQSLVSATAPGEAVVLQQPSVPQHAESPVAPRAASWSWLWLLQAASALRSAAAAMVVSVRIIFLDLHRGSGRT